MSAAPMLEFDDASPVVLRFDLAALTQDLPAAREPQREIGPRLTSLDIALLLEAQKCADGASNMPPRRELVRAAIGEAEYQKWWRDFAEAEKEVFRLRVVELETQRTALLAAQFALVDYAAAQLGCAARADEVLERLRTPATGAARE